MIRTDEMDEGRNVIQMVSLNASLMNSDRSPAGSCPLIQVKDMALGLELGKDVLRNYIAD